MHGNTNVNKRIDYVGDSSGRRWEKKPKQVMLLSEYGYLNTAIPRITTFRSTTDRIYDGGPIKL